MAKKVIDITSGEQPQKVVKKKKKKKKKKTKKVESASTIKSNQPTAETESEELDTFWDDLDKSNEEQETESQTFTDQKTISSAERIEAIDKALKTEYIKSTSYAVVAASASYAQYKGVESGAVKVLSVGSVLLLITSMVRINNLQKTKQSFLIHGFADTSEV